MYPLYTVEPGYNNIGLCDTTSIASIAESEDSTQFLSATTASEEFKDENKT